MPKITTLTGKELLLAEKNQGLQLTIRNPLFNEAGSYAASVPLSGKDDGTNEALNYPMRLTKKVLKQNRIPVIASAGSFQLPAELKVLQPTSKTIETMLYFQDGLFYNKIKDKTLKDVDYGDDIVMGTTAQEVADFINANNAKSLGELDFCFPTIYAPNFYGDNNENYTNFIGLINQYASSIPGIAPNIIGESETSIMPCFFAFYILRKIAETFGYRLIENKVTNNEKYQEIFYIGKRTIDETEGSNYMHAANTGTQSLAKENMPVKVDLTATDDPQSHWNNSTDEYTISEAGKHDFSYSVKTTGYNPGGSFISWAFLVEIIVKKAGAEIDTEYHLFAITTNDYIQYDGHYDGDYDLDRNIYYHVKKFESFEDLDEILDIEYKKSFSFDAADISSIITISISFYKKDTIWNADLFNEFSKIDAELINQSLIITNTDSQQLNRWKKQFSPKNHIPGIKIIDFIKSICGVTGTFPDYNDANKTISLIPINDYLTKPEKKDLSGFIEAKTKEPDYQTIHNKVLLSYAERENIDNYDQMAPRTTTFDVGKENNIVFIKCFDAWFIYEKNDDDSYSYKYLAANNHALEYLSKATDEDNEFPLEISIPPIKMDSLYGGMAPAILDTGISAAYDSDGDEGNGYFALWKGPINIASYGMFYATINDYDYRKNINSAWTYKLELAWLYENLYKKFFEWMLKHKIASGYKAYIPIDVFTKLHKLDTLHILGEDFLINEAVATIFDKYVEIDFSLFLR